MEDRVLEERSEKNPVASIILLSVGRNTYNDAFAVCIGGILSIVSQEFQLSCIATSPVVQHVSISSDRYVNEISEHQEQAIITIGDMYAHEKKELLVYLPIPSVKTTQVVETSLLKTVSCYNNTVSNEMIIVEGETTKTRRPLPSSVVSHRCYSKSGG
ncbi:hypothetical protein KY285_012937 [Solanum tuberosum]|nr:hypothetical protein KY285_012937 [Solanum tuberosum]